MRLRLRWLAWITAGLGLVALAGAGGCNTVKGVGRDIEGIGEAGQRAID